MKVILVALATVVPFGFFIIAGIITCRYVIGLPTGPAMFGLGDDSWDNAVRRLWRRLLDRLRPQLQCEGR